MSVLWTWPELCAVFGLPVIEGPDVTGISIDSRRVQPGDLFIALTGDPGPRFNPSHRSGRDGHEFVADAVTRGAAGVLVHDAGQREIPQLQVADTLDALWQLGRAGRARLHCPVVAVTGSSGKTTAKGFLAAALHGSATAGSLNNHLGVPLSLALTPRNSQAAVFEVGMNHPGEIAPLSELVRPDVAVVLNVHPAHVENFLDIREIELEKISIYKGLSETGKLVLEESIDAATVPEGIEIARFGKSPDARVRLLNVASTDASYEIKGRQVAARVPGGGTHRAMTLAAVICTLDVLGLDLEPALNLPDSLVPTGRGQIHSMGGITLIDDSYNANPVSMRAALESLRLNPGQRRIALLGEMLELGPDGPRFHAELAAYCDGLDGVICVGEGMRALHDALPASLRMGWYALADEHLLDEILKMLTEGDILLIKGSNRVFWARGFVDRLREVLSSAEAS